MVGKPYRSSASFGKRQEYIAVAELLKRHFDVYMTLVDDQQIDCVVRIPGSPPSYIDLQVKARSKSAKHAGVFSALEIREPRENFLFLFYSEPCDTYWVMPSLDVVSLANKVQSGANAGKYRIAFANCNVRGVWKPRPKWKRYENAFDLIGKAEDAGKIAT